MPEPVASTPLVTFACPVCAAPVEVHNGHAGRCPACARPLEVTVFPRLLAAPAAPARPGAAPSDATCFFHPASAALLPCDLCGRYLCALCDVELQGRHLCPTCLQNPASADVKDATTAGEIAYDRLVLTLGWAWLLFWPSWILAAPCSWYFTIRYWKAPRRSLFPRSPWRFVLGNLLLAMPFFFLIFLATPTIR